MKSKPIKKIGAHVPKAFVPADMYTSICHGYEPVPFTDEDEVLSTGTASSLSDEEELVCPVVLPVKKKKVIISILNEEDDYR
jgi:hypothetical protein